MAVDGERIYSQSRVPLQMISDELEGIFGRQLLREFASIIRYYNIYEKGAVDLNTPITDEENETDENIKSKRCAILIDKQSRFMFAAPPDMKINVDKDIEDSSEVQQAYQNIIDKVRKETKLNKKLLKASKDCFIGKRVAYTVNFDDRNGKINISFVPSLGFTYETDPYDNDVLTKLIVFYAVNDVSEKVDQRFYKKKHEMVNGKCEITEGLYNGLGEVVDEKETIKTDFPYIPGGVILNGGLTGDMLGESDVAKIADLEGCYNKMSNKDLDAERKGMNPITVAIDMDSKSTKNLPIVAGSFWDMASNLNADGKTGQVFTIEQKMEYSNALDTTLERIKANSFEILDIPDTSSKGLQGVVSSGKTLKAIYWGLMVRCDEKFNEWSDALEHIVNTIIDGCRMYEKARNRYASEGIPTEEYEIEIANNYPIQDDANEEKEMDIQEVRNGLRSKKSYMKKYSDLTDEEVEEELMQMAKERQIEENAYNIIPAGDQSTTTPTEQEDYSAEESELSDKYLTEFSNDVLSMLDDLLKE